MKSAQVLVTVPVTVLAYASVTRSNESWFWALVHLGLLWLSMSSACWEADVALLLSGGVKKDKGEILRNHETPVIMFPVSSGYRSPQEVAS